MLSYALCIRTNIDYILSYDDFIILASEIKVAEMPIRVSYI